MAAVARPVVCEDSLDTDLVPLEEAQGDPAYQIDPDAVTSRLGDSLVEQMMNVKKLPFPKLPPKPFKELDSICR